MAMERAAMRAYVTGADHLQYTALADGTVQVNATHSNLKQFVMELRLDLHSSIAEVKRKLYTHNGTGVEHMELHLQDASGATLCHMLDDSRPLGYYGVENGMTIHVVDTDPYSLSKDGGLDDVSKIEKYRMSDEDYDKRENTLRAYKRKMLALDPTFKFVPNNRRPAGGAGDGGTTPAIDYTDEACVAGFAVGQRVQLSPGARRGRIAWVGTGVASLAPGYWIGVRLDEPLGHGTGARGGVTYFDAPDKYGTFVRPNFATVGDFPPEFEEDEEKVEGEGAAVAPAPTGTGGGEGTTAAACDGDGAGAPTTSVGAGAGAVPTTTPSVAAVKLSTATTGRAATVGGMRRVGGARRDEDDDGDEDDEL